jgi:hypothetical protein
LGQPKAQALTVRDTLLITGNVTLDVECCFPDELHSSRINPP